MLYRVETFQVLLGKLFHFELFVDDPHSLLDFGLCHDLELVPETGRSTQLGYIGDICL